MDIGTAANSNKERHTNTMRCLQKYIENKEQAK
ncbi:unnamed protein product [uncultured virus]|nr:unnamed protein product [uncultured virus]